MSHQARIKDAQEALEAVFGDRSVEPETTAESLELLQGDVEMMLEALDDDRRRRAQEAP